jgi:pyruvate/2-oxoglutarate dehydrogenase complex dihydrolipoamide acyltransferase (E2) component
MREVGIRAPQGDPPIVTLKRPPKPIIVDPQIAVPTARDRLRHDLLHLLRHDSHTGFVTAVIRETIKAHAAVKASEKRDVVFEPDAGPASTASSEASSERPARALADVGTISRRAATAEIRPVSKPTAPHIGLVCDVCPAAAGPRHLLPAATAKSKRA